jgi:hypothetical protein
MSVIAFASAKSSPGVTTAVVALAAGWPQGRGVLVVEADPAGGDIAPRFDLSTDPGLVTLAAAGRRELSPATLWNHVQTLPGRRAAQVLVAPASAEQAQAALAAVRGRLAEVLGRLQDRDVLVDCGRLDPGSPALELMGNADLSVLVVRPVLSQVHHLHARVASLPLTAPTGLMTIGDSPYSSLDVAGTVRLQLVGSLAHDGRAAAALAGETGTARDLARSDLMRSAAGLAESLVRRLPPRTWGPDRPPVTMAEAGR